MRKVLINKRYWIVILLATLISCQNTNGAPPTLPNDSKELAQIVAQYVKAHEKIKEAQEHLSNMHTYTTADSVKFEREKEKVEAMDTQADKELMESLKVHPQFAPIIQIHEMVKDYVQQRKQADENEDSWEDHRGFESKWDEKLIRMIDEHPDFMEYPGELLSIDLSTIYGIENLSVIDSEDKRLRYYSWHTQRGGSISNIVCFRQFRSDSGKVLLSWGINQEETDCSFEWSYDIDDIITFEINGEKIYLVKANWNHGGGSVSEGYFANIIYMSQIINPWIFHTPDGSKNLLEVEYSCFQWEGEKEVDWMIKYDKEKQNILLRETDSRGYLTGVIIEYTFDGNCFEIKGK